MSKKLTIEYIREQFESEGYTLLTDTYINTRQKLDYICPVGHRHSIGWEHWGAKRPRRCKLCGIKKSAATRSHDISYIRKEFEKYGYKLLSKEYKESTYQKLEYACPKGHIHKMTYSSFKKGTRCRFCANERTAGNNRKYTIETVKKAFEDEGYILLNKEYNGPHDKLDYICPLGHRHNTVTWATWNLRGYRCKTCGIIKNSGEMHFNWQGGLNTLPYCDAWADKEYKEDIKKRDNYKCQNPYCYNDSNVLCVHHIDYTKTICGPDNLITVCRNCNTRANYNREWHTEWYRTIMNKKYGYEYKEKEQNYDSI